MCEFYTAVKNSQTYYYQLWKSYITNSSIHDSMTYLNVGECSEIDIYTFYTIFTLF